CVTIHLSLLSSSSARLFRIIDVREESERSAKGGIRVHYLCIPFLNFVRNGIAYCASLGQLLFVGALKLGRIGKTPMQGTSDTRENRTTFGTCFVANRNNLVKYFS